MSLQPLRDYLLVMPDPLNEHASTSGIIIQQRKDMHDSQAQLGRTGTVIAVGTGKKWRTKQRGNLRYTYADHQTPQIQPGDRVLFGEFTWPEHGDCLILQEADIAGIIE